MAEFLSRLVAEQDVAASTQHQGLSALAFLYRGVLYPELRCFCTSARPDAPVACYMTSRQFPARFHRPSVYSSWTDYTFLSCSANIVLM